MSLFQGPKNKNATSAPRQNNEDAQSAQPTVGSTPYTERMARIKVMADDYNERRNTKVKKSTPESTAVAEPAMDAAVASPQAALETAPSAEPSLAPSPEATMASPVAAPTPLPDPGPMGGLNPNPPSKREFFDAVGANRSSAEPARATPSKKDFLEAVGANKPKPSQPDTGPTKKDFLEAVGANKQKASEPDKGPTKKDFLEAVGANKSKPSEPDKGPTKKDFLEAVGANKPKPSQPDTGPTKKDFLAAVNGEAKPATSVETPTPAATTAPTVGGETALTETPALETSLNEGAVAPPTNSPAGAMPEMAAAPEAAPEAPVVEEKPAEELPKEAPAAEAGAEAPGAPGEGEGEGEKEKPKAEKPKSKGFLAAVANIKKTAEEQTEHAPPEALSEDAQAAAEVPENESMGEAQAEQVDEMAEQEPVEFSAANFKSMLMARIAEMQLPETNEEADDFENNNNIDEVNEASKADVQAEKDKAAGPIQSTNEKAPDPSAQPKRVAETLPPLDPGKKLKSAKANKAVPDPRPDSEVSQPLQEETAKMDDTMAANNVTDKQLEISQEPKFEKALGSKNEAKAEAQKAPEQLRQQEAGTLQQTGEKAEGTSQEQLAGMNMMRGTSMQQVAGGQQAAGTKDTTEREKVAIKIDGIFKETQDAVTKILDNLDLAVEYKFGLATKRAKQAFEDHVELKMAVYKARRYGGKLGGLRWTKDLFMGLPDEVNEFFVEGRQVFVDVMDEEITVISELVAGQLNRAKQRVETGKQEVTDYVNSLPANLKAVGKEAADDIQDKFDALTEDVNAKQDELVDTMADQYTAALEEVDERIEEMKAANRGLVDMAMDMINGVLETIRKLTEAINNLMSAIASVIGIIMADPIGFMGMLFDGIGKGIDMFKANIEKHMLGGLIGWLTGSLGPMGITMPDDIFSLKGIFSLVMQVLGLGWDFLRAKSVKMMGEPMVNALETGSDMFKTFASKGIDGIYEYLKDSFNDLKETVIDAIKSMLITQVIEAGIKWLLSLLIPGAGFIKAIMAIKDIIVFFVESAIMLIPAITEAILALAGGSIAGVGIAIEKGLGLLLPLVIGLFAKLIGLGGLSKRVMKIFKKIRKRVDKAVNKLLKKAKKAGRKLMRKLKGKGKKGDAKKIKDENKKGKPEELTAKDKAQHKKINKKIIETLQKTDKSDKDLSFKDLHNKKKKEADKLEDKYQPQLKKGINLDIQFNSVGADEKDGDIDFTSKIAPNNDEQNGEITLKSLPVDGKVLLVYHDEYGKQRVPHYQVILSNGNVHDLALNREGKIEIRLFSLLKGSKEKDKITVNGTKFIELNIDQEKVDKMNPFNESGNKQGNEEKSKELQKLKKKYESGEYATNSFDCFSFSIDFINKVINLNNVQVLPKGRKNPEKFDSISKKK